ncbi:MAG: prepilin-type N-terminal cleavage/methylation domain-containing protein [Verrucomicrobia bacterium]|nr:prepilin-type N-terminal cleavage/methylation domain-containing protein [Verrucomicrobiota bacterium]
MNSNPFGVRRQAEGATALLSSNKAAWHFVSRRTPQRAGLTLIEVMLSIVILGIGSGVLMLATARCIAVVSKARHYSNAQRFIFQIGAEHPLTRGEIDAGIESGEFDGGYEWEREVVEPEDENREGLYTIRTRISWSTRGKECFEEIVTWHYIPVKEDL